MRARYSIAICSAALALWLTAGFGGVSSPLADAAMKGDKAAVKSLIAQKADVNSQQSDGATALQWAAYHGDVELADMLIAAGADVKKANQEGATPLYLASLEGNAALIEKLLKAGSDANEKFPTGDTPLMLASRTGNVEAIKVLLGHKADVNAKDDLRGTTPLMWAAEQGHPEAVKALIAAGADVKAITKPDTRNARNNLANTFSERANSSFAVGGLVKNGTPTVPGAGNPDTDVTVPGPVGAAPAKEGPAPPTAPNGGRPLPAAVASAATPGGRGAAGGGRAAGGRRGAPAAATPDGEAGAAAAGGFGRGAAKADGGGLTPLVFAARENCLECVKALLDGGADINQRTNYGWTALLTATQNRHYKLGAYLMDRGADVKIANLGGWTPLYLAVDNRNIESGDYPTRVADMDHLAYVKMLIAKGADVNARVCGVESTPDRCKGDTTETRNNFTMQWLFEDGATPFLRAAQSGDIVLMKLLLEHGADPKIATGEGVTPLMAAAGYGWVDGITFEWSPKDTQEAVKMCLDLGIDVNAVESDTGRSALHVAANKGRPEVVQMLVDHGANLMAADKGSRDTINGDLVGKRWIALDWSRGKVRVGVQSAIPHPEVENLLVKLMKEKGLEIPAAPTASRCLTPGDKGCR